MLRCLPTFALLLLTTAPGTPATRPSTSTTQPPAATWGEARSGFRIAAAVEGDAVAHQRLRIDVFLRNDTPIVIQVKDAPQAREAFAWVLAATDRDNAFYTRPFLLRDLLNDADLAPGQTTPFQLDMVKVECYPSGPGMKIVSGYPKAEAQPMPQQLRERLAAGKVRLQVFVYLPSAGGESLLLRSAPIAVNLQASPATSQPAGTIPDLDAAFRRDAFAAKAAHDRSVQMGAPARATAAAIARDRHAPDFASAWATATLADIGGDESAALLIDLLSAGSNSSIIAYYAPAMKNPAIDAALVAHAVRPGEETYTAWLARGYARAKRRVPDDLARRAAESELPMVRLEATEALAQREHHALLAKLITDSDPRVRTKAAQVCRDQKLKEPQLLKALVKSLDQPGTETAACDALAAITSLPWRLEPNQSAAQRERTLAKWRAWAANP